MKTKIVLIILTALSIIIGYLAGYLLDWNKRPSLDTPKPPTHYSTPYQKEFFENAFAVNNQSITTNDQGDIKGIIVNHHLLAPGFIAEAIQAIATDKPITIILVSPNHFSRGNGAITLTTDSWDTPYGVLESNKELAEKLITSNLVTLDDVPFDKEHGISNIVGFIKKALPNAKIIPIILRDVARDEDVDALSNGISKIPEPILIIGSLDFSHYLPSNAADLHDAKSLAVIDNFDYQSINSVEIDSKPTLRLILKYLEAKLATQFHLLQNSNSAKLTGNDTLQETTSYITGYFTEGAKINNPTVTLLAFGDMMLDRYIRVAIKDNGMAYVFESIRRLLDGNDIVLANLEGAFTDLEPQPPRPNNLEFTFDPLLIPKLQKLGFNLFSLANNHSGGFGLTGLEQTKNYLKNYSIDFFGNPSNTDRPSFIKEIRETKIAFVGYNQFGQNSENIIKEIENIKINVDFVVVMAHWGIEYQDTFSKNQQETAHQFIDAGADIVIGSHPHVIQPIEIYKNKTIFYSLGNFVFDQLSSDKTKQGLALGIELQKGEYKFYLLPFIMQNWQVRLLDKENSDMILKRISEHSVTSQNIKNQIQKGIFNIIK